MGREYAGGGNQGRPEAGPPDIDDATRQCIIGVLGYMPESPDDMTEDQKRTMGQQCFPGGQQGGPGGPHLDDLDEVTRKCIINAIGRMPESENDVTEEEKLIIGRECFNDLPRGDIDSPQGPGLDDTTSQCVVNILGFPPENPRN